jgi:hypothetical protein
VRARVVVVCVVQSYFSVVKPDLLLTWRVASDVETNKRVVSLPLYTDNTRRSLLLEISLPCSEAISPSVILFRGCCLVANNFER